MRLLCLNEGETGARLYLVQNRSNLRPLPTFQLKVAPSDAGDQKEERSWKTQDRPLLPLSLRTAVLNHALLFFFFPLFSACEIFMAVERGVVMPQGLRHRDSYILHASVTVSLFDHM